MIKAAPNIGGTNEPGSIPHTRVNLKKHKSINIKDIDTGHSWKIETVEDVDKYIGQLKEKLLQELKKEEGTILNILL